MAEIDEARYLVQDEGFGKGGLNNAYLLSVGLYHRHFSLFEKAVASRGNSLQEALLFFKTLAAQKGDMVEKTKQWVNR